MPIEVTDEMRQAVLAETCATQGHMPSFENMVANKTAGRDISGQNGKEPYVQCTRCQKVWLVVADPGSNYDEAMTKFRGRLRDGDPKKSK